MNKFSIVTIYWGSDPQLEDFIRHCKKWTDDIVVVYVDLHNKKFKSRDANIITIDHKFLLKHGYGETFNLGISRAKHDWTYIMGVGKEIVKINRNVLKRISTTDAAGFASVYFGKENETKWIKFSNRTKSKIMGVIHEEPVPFESSYISYGTFASWRYTNKTGSDPLSNINEGYRALSRLKWYYLYNKNIHRSGPDSYKNSMKFLQKLWGKSGIDKINALYEKYEHLYDLNAKELCKELSEINDWQDYRL